MSWSHSSQPPLKSVIVIIVNIVINFGFQFIKCITLIQIQLILPMSKVRFLWRVVPTVSFSRHGFPQIVVLNQFLKLNTCIMCSSTKWIYTSFANGTKVSSAKIWIESKTNGTSMPLDNVCETTFLVTKSSIVDRYTFFRENSKYM